MADTHRYTGSCHCGAVTFEVDMPLESVVSCNCSHCSRKGFLLAFVPAEQFTLLSGQEALSEYRFNRKAIAHKFCKHCGVQAFAYGAMPDGSPSRAVNARCLDDLDLAAVPVQQVDGKQF